MAQKRLINSGLSISLLFTFEKPFQIVICQTQANIFSLSFFFLTYKASLGKAIRLGDCLWILALIACYMYISNSWVLSLHAVAVARGGSWTWSEGEARVLPPASAQLPCIGKASGTGGDKQLLFSLEAWWNHPVSVTDLSPLSCCPCRGPPPPPPPATVSWIDKWVSKCPPVFAACKWWRVHSEPPLQSHWTLQNQRSISRAPSLDRELQLPALWCLSLWICHEPVCWR